MSLTYTQLDALTNKYIEKKVSQNVYDVSAFLAFLKAKGKVNILSGGTKITRPVNVSALTMGGSFSGSDTLSITEEDVVTSAEFNWKQYWTGMRLSKRDININSGDEAKVSLMMERADMMKANMNSLMETGIFGAGTSSDKGFDGLQILLSESATYGGIAVADMALWKANVEDNSSTNRPVSLPLLQLVYGQCCFNGQEPVALVCKQDVFNSIWGLYQPHQRIGNELMAKLGFSSLEFNGKPVIVSNYAPANSVLFIGDDLRLDVHRNDNMAISSLSTLESSETMIKRITVMGNLTAAVRRQHGWLKDVA